MRAALRAEWSKLRTLPDFAVSLTLIVVLTVAVSAASAAGGAGPDPVHVALLGVQLGQAVAAIAGVQILAGEYGSGLIHCTLLAVPRRARLLSAKAALLTGGVAAAALVALAGSALTGGLLLPSLPAGGPLLRAVTGSILYLILIALLGLGTAAAVRNTVAAAGVVLSLLYVLPVILRMLPDPDWQRWVYRLTPSSAVQSIQTTVGTSGLPLGPWPSLAVTAGWSAAALALGLLLLTRRDA